MRIWDVPCSKHLLGEHVELHCMWSVHQRGLTGGYSRHPETLRWTNHIPALFLRHEEQVEEMTRRGFNHRSPLVDSAGLLATGSVEWPSQTLPGAIPKEAQ